MYQNLKKLASSKTYRLDDLIKAFADWKQAGATEHQDFVNQRLKLATKCAGAYFDESNTMSTSGSTSGIKKKYKWGPSYHEMWLFFEWLKFNWFNFKSHYYIKPTRNCPQVWITSKNMPENKFIVATDIENIAGQSQTVWEMTTNKGNSPIILWIMPTYSKLLIDKGFNFSPFDPQKTIIHATGEPTPQSIKDYFTSRGYHYIDEMRCWTGGATFITCQHGNAHWIDMLSVINTEDKHLLATDLFNLGQLFKDYETGDIITTSRGETCKCGLPVDTIQFFDRTFQIELAGLYYTYQDMFNIVDRSITEHQTDNHVLMCSFGFHNASNSVIIFYETAKPIATEKLGHVISSIKSEVSINRNIRLVNEHQSNLFKTNKLFNLTDDEYKKVIGKATVAKLL